jgi:uncharacterized protein involved in outer membrane biogenesis
MNSRWRRGLAWTGIVLASIVVLAVIALALIDWNALRGPIERFATAHSGRTVKIEGPLEVHIWSWTPRISVQRLTVGNPPWEAAKPMVKIERLNAQLKLLPLLKGDVILPRVEIVRPDVYLHREPSGRANWTFENTKPTNAKADKPPKLPVVRDFLIQEGKLIIHDELLHLDVNGTVQAHEKGSENDPKAFRIEGQGTLNKEPFSMRVAGGPLVNLDPDHPYPFDMAVDAGDIHLTSNGNVRKPFDLGKLTFNVQASGSDLANLFYLTQLALPNTPPFTLSAHIERNEKLIKVTNIDGTIGQSDLRGDITVDASRKRPSISGELVSKQLRLKDLAASLGGKPKAADSLAKATEPPKPSKKGAAEKAPANAKLFPDARLQVERVRAMDGDVKFSAQSIQAGTLPLKEVAFHIKLDDGVLALAPFEFTMPQGKIEGTANIDARGKTPLTKLDVRVRNVQLDQLKGKAPDAKPPLGGIMQARATVEGHGDSVHDLMADADGKVSLVLPHGQVNAAFAELTGINVARGIGLLIKGDEERTEIRCGIAQFKVKDGLMTADNVVFDTTNVRITGRGDIKLGPEELDLSIKGEPKKLRLARLRTPIEIKGHLKKPSIGIDTGKTVKQGAIAAALGAALTPLAAIVAFVDPGLAKDENCGALLANTANPNAKTGASP